MIRPGALKKFAIVSPAPCDWLLKRGTLLIGMSPLFNWPHRLSGKTKNGRRNMRDEAANKIFKIDAATLAMCACTKNPNRRRDASEGNKNVYGAWHVYMCIYIYTYMYISVLRQRKPKRLREKIGESFVLSETEKASDFVANFGFGY